MINRILLIGVCCYFVCSQGWCVESTDEFTFVKDQAREERNKEAELQIMRLELERLKLQLETRKTMSDLGLASGMASSVDQVSQIIIDLKSVILAPGKVAAVIEAGGVRKSVKVGDIIGALTVKQVNADEIVLIDTKGVLTRVALRL